MTRLKWRYKIGKALYGGSRRGAIGYLFRGWTLYRRVRWYVKSYLK